MTPNHSLYGPENVQSNVDEGTMGREGKEEGNRPCKHFVFIFRPALSNKHDLSAYIFKNPGSTSLRDLARHIGAVR